MVGEKSEREETNCGQHGLHSLSYALKHIIYPVFTFSSNLIVSAAGDVYMQSLIKCKKTGRFS